MENLENLENREYQENLENIENLEIIYNKECMENTNQFPLHLIEHTATLGQRHVAQSNDAASSNSKIGLTADPICRH